MNFGILVRMEPALLTLLDEAVALDKKGKTPAKLMSIWYHDFKPRMEHLAGMHVRKENAVLGTSAAYDCAYETLYGALTGEALR